MMPVPADVMKSLADLSRQRHVVAWLREWRNLELERLPNVVTDVARAQGRCQVLGELTRLIEKSPDHAAAAPTKTDRSG